MGKGGTVLGFIGIILAAGAIGFTYIVWNGQNTTNNLTGTRVVGIWESLSDNQVYTPYNSLSYWLLEFGDNSLSNTNYISVSNTNTRITLLKAGWYRIHLTVLLEGLNPANLYFIVLLKDGVAEFIFDKYETSLAMNSQYHSIDSSAFVYSNGTNYVEINGYSAFGDNFDVPVSNKESNRLTIEFVTI